MKDKADFYLDLRYKSIAERMGINKVLEKDVEKRRKSIHLYETLGIILSAHQNASDLETAANELEVGRRVTGGGAVLTIPDQTIQYSMFISEQEKDEFYEQLSSRLNLSYDKKHAFFYDTNKDNKIIGHATKKLKDEFVQLDGLVNLQNDFTQVIPRYIKMREFYGRSIKVGDELVSSKYRSQIPELKEIDEISKISSLNTLGITKKDFLLEFTSIVNDMFDLNPSFTDDLNANPVVFNNYQRYLKGKGHCFIYPY